MDMTKEQAKEQLISKLQEQGVYYDDMSDNNEGWTLQGGFRFSEDDFNELLDEIDPEADSFDLAEKALEGISGSHELGQYTNIYYYFFREEDAQQYLDNLITQIRSL